jgi:DNA polymerase III subunit epsilon
MRFHPFRRMDPRTATYVANTPRKFMDSTPISEIDFVIVDAETSGFNVSLDSLLSLSALPVRSDRARIGQMKTWIIYHANAHVTPATKIHTILPSESSRGLPIEEVLTEFISMISGSIVVGHHVHFDARVIDAEMRLLFGSGIRNPLVDTAMMAMKSVEAFRSSGYPNQRPPGLDELCASLGIPPWGRHTADGDTFTTAQLFLLLCARVKQKLGRDLTIGDLPVSRFQY